MLCKSTTQRGTPCQARAQAGSAHCFFHNRDAFEKRREAQRRGGRGNQHARAALPEIDLDLTNPKEILGFVAMLAKRVYQGHLDAKSCHAICHCLETGQRVFENGILQSKIERIARLLEAESNRPLQKADIDDLLRFEPDETVPAEVENKVKTSNGFEESR